MAQSWNSVLKRQSRRQNGPMLSFETRGKRAMKEEEKTSQTARSVMSMLNHVQTTRCPEMHTRREIVACLTSQQHASASRGRICTDNFACCHTEIEVADQTFYLTQLQYTDTGPTSSNADPITSGAWQGSHWSAYFEVTGMTRPRKNPGASGIRTRDLSLSRRTPQPLG